MTDVPSGQEVAARAHPPPDSGTRRSSASPNCTAPLAEDTKDIASRTAEIMLTMNGFKPEMRFRISIKRLGRCSWDVISFNRKRSVPFRPKHDQVGIEKTTLGGNETTC